MSQSLFFCPHYSGPATRNSQNLAPLLLHKPVHQSHPTVLVNKKSGNTKAVYIVLHSHVVHLFCTLHARYTTYLTSHEVSMWSWWLVMLQKLTSGIWKKCVCWQPCYQGFKRYGNPDMPFLETLKNKIQIKRFLTINMNYLMSLYLSGFLFNLKLANLP